MDFLTDLLLGGTSGVIAKTACAPLERVKIVLQTQSVNTQIGKQYSGIADAFARIAREQGMASFWRGNFANCLRYFPTQAMNFAFKEKYQALFVRPKEEVGFALFFAGYLAAGAAAGATSLTVSYPLEFTYTRMAADVGGPDGKRQYNGIVDCVQKTLKTDGIRGLYRGYGPSVAGIVVYRAGYFGLYDYSKSQLIPSLNLSHGTLILAKFGIALSIDIFSAMLAYPLDTVRRNMMMQSGRASSEVLFTSSIGCLNHIIAKDGVKGLYKGALMNNFRAIGSALVLVIYDELRAALKPGSKGSH
jgi:solute carrier family 25 (adenine nucleotide translocator) protein 4/5/6/31